MHASRAQSWAPAPRRSKTMKKWLSLVLVAIPFAIGSQTFAPESAAAVRCADCPVLDTGGGWSEGGPSGGGSPRQGACTPVGACVNHIQHCVYPGGLVGQYPC